MLYMDGLSGLTDYEFEQTVCLESGKLDLKKGFEALDNYKNIYDDFFLKNSFDADYRQPAMIKGASNEMANQKIFDAFGIKNQRIPLEYADWMKISNKSYDDVIFGKAIEYKFMLTPVNAYYIEKDWLPRTAKIFVVNDKSMIPYDCMKMLHDAGREVYSLREFIEVILKKILPVEGGNKRTAIVGRISMLKDLFLNLNDGFLCRVEGNRCKLKP